MTSLLHEIAMVGIIPQLVSIPMMRIGTRDKLRENV
jgi:hypothetical protein